MYTCMCNWVPILYGGKKKLFGEITIKKEKNQEHRITSFIRFTAIANEKILVFSFQVYIRHKICDFTLW